MQFVSSREFRIRPGDVWKRLSEHDLVVTNNGKPVAILARVDEEDFEQTLVLLRRLRAQIAVEKIRRNASEHASPLSDQEIEAEIHLARQARRHRV